jgi:type 1 glutamine amidotransferase
MRTAVLVLFALLFHSTWLHGQVKSLEPIELNDAWKAKISGLTPSETQVPVSKKKKVLLFSLFTGYEHWTIPHVDYVIQTIGEKTGAYEVVKSVDISMFEKKALKQFDAIVLNNNCSVSDRRDLFYDALGADSAMSEDAKIKKAGQLELNLLNFVKKGGGLAILHGGIVMQNNSMRMSEMTGGSFDYHPPQQQIELVVVDKTHPLTLPFGGESFTHIDEPYFFKNAYAKKNFKPLLFMEVSKIEKMKHEHPDDISYVSWIKPYGKGKIFYSSPSHNAQSYENTRMLGFYLNGMQYVLGDLKCDDIPMNP